MASYQTMQKGCRNLSSSKFSCLQDYRRRCANVSKVVSRSILFRRAGRTALADCDGMGGARTKLKMC